MTELQGTTSIDAAYRFEPDLLSYRSAAEAAHAITKQVREVLAGRTVVVTDAGVFADLANLEAAVMLLDDLRASLVSLRVRTDVDATASAATSIVAAPALAALQTGVSTALGLVSLFREDREYTGRQTTVHPLNLELALAGALRAAGIERVLVPDFVVTQVSTSRIATALARAHDALATVWQQIAPLVQQIAQLEADLDAAARAQQQQAVDDLTQRVSVARAAVQPVLDPVTQAEAQLRALQTQLATIDAQSGLSLCSRWLRAETLQAQRPCYLYAAVACSGGGYLSRHNLWQTLFGNTVRASGGIIVRWAVLDETGSVLAAGQLDRHEVLNL